MYGKEAIDLKVISDNISYVLRNVWLWDRAVLFFITAAAITGALIPLGGIYMPKAVIDVVTHTPTASAIVGVVAGFTFVLTALNVVNKYATGYVNASAMSNRMRYLFMSNEKTMHCDYESIESAAGQQMRNKLNAAINKDTGGPQLILRTLPGITSGFAGLVLYGGVLSRLNPIIFILLLFTSGANFFVLRRITRHLERFRDENSYMLGKFSYLSYRLRDFTAGKDVRVFNMMPWFMAVFDGLLKRDRVRLWEAAAAQYLSTITDAVILLLRDGIAYAFLISYAVHGKISVSDFVLYFGAITGFGAFVSAIIQGVNDLIKSSLDITVIREFLDMPDGARGAVKTPGELPVCIDFCDVSFRYGENEPWILDRLNIQIKRGEKLALVGVNGAGKTTIIKLLCGFYRPTSGEIRINGVSVNDYEREAVYAMMTAVFQDILIMPVSAAKNVALAETYDARRVRQCLDEAGLSQRLPDINAPLTKIIDPNGVELSGGEQQKLLLARALYKDAPIMLLDEPTAALDPIAESILYQRYNYFSKTKTSIYISHRLASASFCDRVAFLDSGKITELGTHDELIRQNGGYANMYRLQSHYYREGSHE